MTKPTDAERCLERAAQLRASPTIGDAIPHFIPSLRELADRCEPERNHAWTRTQGERRSESFEARNLMHIVDAKRFPKMRGPDRRSAVPPFAERTQAERDRPLTPVQFSEALQIIAGRPIPPALGEFALQERHGLLDEIKRLREAVSSMAACNQHTGQGPHCTCSQWERDRIARAALAPQERK